MDDKLLIKRYEEANENGDKILAAGLARDIFRNKKNFDIKWLEIAIRLYDDVREYE